MSWFTSLFSSSNTTATPTPPQTKEPRILEVEPSPSDPVVTPSPAQPRSLAGKPIAQGNRNRNKIVFAAGAAFFGFSVLVTRRAIARRHRALVAETLYAEKVAKGETVSTPPPVNSTLEAIEALNVATINVLSIAMMATSGVLWYLDINSMDEARFKMRRAMGVDVYAKTEDEANEEIEEWIASTLARKEQKELAKSKVQPLPESGKHR